ncbi:LysM repeat protein [Thermonema lapsum]|uniref:LysM repeat protein n=1 Tax=Thermonema lapsum TaxID=28195 RepID=A0A846MSK7_9BACT|nr:LysM peptidoglycan-binding domain-containing protein [Thermonema lapsum]NIK74237.1 LysM repeat protein [Thermonema lapsum]
MIQLMEQFFPQYRIESFLKEDAYFVYHLARHSSGRLAVIQSIAPDYQGKSSVIERIKQYAGTVNELQHPMLPLLYDFLITDNNAFLIWEHLDGTNIDQYMQQQSKALSERKAQRLVLSLISVLEFLIQKGEAPPRLDTEMIWITSDERIKLRGIIDESTPKGLCYHPSREQLHAPQDYVQAVGLVWYHLITGKHPRSLGEEHILKGTLPPAANFYPGVFEHVEHCLAKAIHPNPAKRYPNLQELQKAILAARIQTLTPEQYSFVELNAPLVLLVFMTILTAFILWRGSRRDILSATRVAYYPHDISAWQEFEKRKAFVKAEKESAESLFLSTQEEEEQIARDYLHKVSPGETLTEIAERYNMTPEHLLRINNLASADNIQAGVGLKVKVRAIHKINVNESPHSIAQKYGISLEELLKANGLSDIDTSNKKVLEKEFYPGRELIIPISQ